MNFTAVEFDKSELSRDVSNMRSITLEEHEALYKYLVGYIAGNLVGPGNNLFTSVLPSKPSRNEVQSKNVHGRIVYKLGTGDYSFQTFDGKIMHALHHHLGEPVGTDCGVKIMKRLVLFSEGSWEDLASFLNSAVEDMETTEDDKFICYSWRIRYNYWDEETKVNKRPIDSVVLPSALKSRMVNDMTKFLDPKTKDFYLRNGIPYRRSYLFFGTPGTGKTSMVQALAGHFGRNVCFLMPTHPDMTDDSLRSAVNSIPENSIVVFEDIDALFDKDRSNQIKKSSLTFSGLLNALDGIGHANGQIFVLTTNLRENLDHALIRNGRVDLHFEFTYAVAEQMELMWRNFYPSAADRAVEFASAVGILLKENKLEVTTAALQHFFVTQMDSSPEEALQNVGLIVEEVRQNSSDSMLKEATAAATTGKKKKNKKNKKAKKNGESTSVGKNPSPNVLPNEAIPPTISDTPAATLAPSSATVADVVVPSAESGAKEKKKNKKNKNKKTSKEYKDHSTDQIKESDQTKDSEEEKVALLAKDILVENSQTVAAASSESKTPDTGEVAQKDSNMAPLSKRPKKNRKTNEKAQQNDASSGSVVESDAKTD